MIFNKINITILLKFFFLFISNNSEISERCNYRLYLYYMRLLFLFRSLVIRPNKPAKFSGKFKNVNLNKLFA